MMPMMHDALLVNNAVAMLFWWDMKSYISNRIDLTNSIFSQKTTPFYFQTMHLH